MNIGEEQSQEASETETTPPIPQEVEPSSSAPEVAAATEESPSETATEASESQAESSPAESSSEASTEATEAPETTETPEAPAAPEPEASSDAEPQPSETPGSYEEFQKRVDAQSEPGDKLEIIIDFMQDALAQTGSPRFKEFWEARKLCLPLFKSNVPPGQRAHLWERYSNLSKEARRLKDILDEQASFAIEQIDIAIGALEKELGELESGLSAVDAAEFENVPATLKDKMGDYQNAQGQLNLLNVYASRVNGLRKELLKTEMRIRHKNKFFQRLSSAGDLIFPRRKQLIKEVSESFVADVNDFVKENFNGPRFKEAIFTLREEIKLLQSVAKSLTLNTHAFSETRKSLSQCWDKIREADKERKKERVKRRQENQEQVDEIKRRLTEFSEAYENENLSVAEANKRLDAINSFMRSQRLGRDEVKELRAAFATARKPVEECEQKEQEERRRREEEKAEARRKKLEELQGQCDALLEQSESLSADDIEAKRDEVCKLIDDSDLLKADKQTLERHLRPLKELLLNKREEALLALSQDDQESLKTYRSILDQRKERLAEFKEQWEELRKAKGASGLDFSKAMEMEQLLGEKREEIERAEAAIAEIEGKIQELKAKV